MKIKYKFVVLIILLVLTAGCIRSGPTTNNSTKTQVSGDTINIKSFENRGPMLTDGDFPDFKLLGQQYLVTYRNLTSTLDTETVHGSIAINSTDNIPQGFRVYGDSEMYSSNERFILIQYKVYDTDSKLNDSLDLTIGQYLSNGFSTKIVKNSSLDLYKDRRIYVLENGVSNKNVSINKNMNVTIILFGFDNIVGKIGVEDTKEKSLNESVKVLGIVFKKLNVKSETVESQKIQSSHSIVT